MNVHSYNERPSSLGVKLLVAVGVLLLLVAVAIINTVPPAAGYEISLYDAYPWYFWLAVVGAMFAGQLVVLLSILVRDVDDRDLTFGIGLITIPGVTLTFMPYFRGYPVYGRADVLTHVGMVRDLSEMGIGSNIYPLMHILIQSLAGATGLDLLTVTNLPPIVFTIVFLGSMFYMTVYLFEDYRWAIAILPIVLVPLGGSGHVVVAPYVLSTFLMPFVLFLLLKEQRTHAVSVRALLVFAIVGVVLYHPLTALFGVAVFGIYSVLKRIPAFNVGWTGPTYVASLAVVVFSAWYVNFAGIVFRFRNVIDELVGPGEGGQTQLDATTATLERTSPDPFDVLRIAVYQYGIDALLFALAAAFVALVVVRWWRGGDAPDLFVLLFGGVAGLFGLSAVLFLTNDLIVGFGRPLAFGRSFAAVLAGALCYSLWRNADDRNRRIAGVAAASLVMLIVAYLAVFSMFHAPHAAQTNHQVTEMEIDGMEWTFANRNEDLLIDEFGIRQHRFYHMQHGTDEVPLTIRGGTNMPPPHFNYTEYETLGESYDDDRYLLLTQRGRIAYPAQFPDYREHWQFTPEDFDRLERDRSVDRVYDNGEFNAYRISSA